MENIPDGTSVFIDANIFIYDILAVPEYVNSCNSFLKRVESGAIKGFTSILVISEVIHKLMFSEMIEKYGMKPGEVLAAMKNNPDLVGSLDKYENIISKISKIGIKVLPNSDATHRNISYFIKKYKLMSNDAINVTLMKEHDLINIATNDKDFERIDFITLWKP